MVNLDFISSVLGNNKKGNGISDINNFVIDSHSVESGNCFIGILGTVDGGSFFCDALKKGACGLILHKKYETLYLERMHEYPGSWAFFVDDTKQALLGLAKKWRSFFTIPIIAITGSVGKTTTKELIKSILEETGFQVCATKNSQNGSIGLPLTILNLRPYHTFAVFELGIQKIGEMDILLDIVQSITYGLVTTILPSHMQYFKTIETIIQEKIKLQTITKEIFFIDVLFKKYAAHKYVITFGDEERADIYYYSMSTKISIEELEHDKKYYIDAMYHKGINHCIVAAFTVCYFLKINPDIIIQAIKKCKRVEGRFSIHNLKRGGIIINDCYSASNAKAVVNSIEAFEIFPTHKKKIIVLADMLEQGNLEEQSHNIVIERVDAILNSAIEKVFYVGKIFQKIIDSSGNRYKNNAVVCVHDFLAIDSQIYNYLDQQYCVLFKGSNGMKLFKHVSEYIKQEHCN